MHWPKADSVHNSTGAHAGAARTPTSSSTSREPPANQLHVEDHSHQRPAPSSISQQQPEQHSCADRWGECCCVRRASNTRRTASKQLGPRHTNAGPRWSGADGLLSETAANFRRLARVHGCLQLSCRQEQLAAHTRNSTQSQRQLVAVLRPWTLLGHAACGQPQHLADATSPNPLNPAALFPQPPPVFAGSAVGATARGAGSFWSLPAASRSWRLFCTSCLACSYSLMSSAFNRLRESKKAKK